MKRSNRDSLGLLSFVAVILFAASFLLSKLGANMGFFVWIGNGILLVVVLALAYNYSQKLSNTWQIVFYIIAILAVLAFIYGIGVF